MGINRGNQGQKAWWPHPATTVAGTTSPWNFGQIVAAATGADGDILTVRHDGAVFVAQIGQGRVHKFGAGSVD